MMNGCAIGMWGVGLIGLGALIVLILAAAALVKFLFLNTRGKAHLHETAHLEHGVVATLALAAALVSVGGPIAAP